MGKSKRGGGFLDTIKGYFTSAKNAVTGTAEAAKDAVITAVPSAKPVVDGDALTSTMGTQPQGNTTVTGGRRTRRHHKKHKKTQKRRH
jgi:hypothetical protein